MCRDGDWQPAIVRRRRQLSADGEASVVVKAAIIVLSSDDGLCGAYNVNIFKGLLETLARMRQEAGPEVRVEIVPVGRKMRRAVEKIATTDPI